MKKYNTFILFSIITFTWALFFAMYKFFIWGDLTNNGLSINLQDISAYLSLGGIPAYILGSAIAYTFLKKYILFLTALISSILVGVSYIFPIGSDIYFIIITSIIGFIYGIWSVFKNILIAIEIKRTGLKDTFVNGIISTLFIIALILGTISGNLIYEKLSSNGYIIIIFLLIFTSIISFFLNYDNTKLGTLLENGYKNYINIKKITFKNSLKKFFPDLKYVYNNYQPLIISSALLWSITTIISQKAIEFSVITFSMTNTNASMLLLFSALGTIIGNILSMKLEKFRWIGFYIGLFTYGLILIAFTFISSSFINLIYLSLFLGIVFGIISNLLDGYFFQKIGNEDKKESGGSVFGLILSINVFGMMKLANYIDINYGLNSLMMSFNVFFILIAIILYKHLINK